MTNLPYSYPRGGPFWVSPTGDDSALGTQAAPWATLAHARSYIRDHFLNVVQRADIAINVKAGTYTAGVSLSELDSGFNGHRVIWTAVDGVGTVVIDGGTTISSWTNVGGNIWRAAIPNACYTVYRDGVRMRPARTPKLIVNPSYPVAKGPYLLTQDNGSKFAELKYNNADFDPSSWTLSNLRAIIWAGGTRAWLTDTQAIIARDTTAKTLTFGQDGKLFSYALGTGSRYFMENAQALLTEDGEFYLDVAGGFLYVFGDPSAHTFVIPSATNLVTVSGSNRYRPATNISIDGFTIQNTDFLPTFRMGYPSNGSGTIFGPEGHADTFYAYWDSIPAAKLGALSAVNTNGVRVTRCHFNRIGTNGAYFGGYGTGIIVQNNLVEHVGISGIVQEGGYSGEGDKIGGSLFDNNRIRYMGELAGHATGLQIGNSGNNTITHNEFTDGPRHGSWYYGSYNQRPVDVYTKNNATSYCLYERLCQDSGDTAGIYVESLSSRTGGPYNVNTWDQCIVNGCNAHPSMTDVVPNGVFTDNETWNQEFSNIETTDTQGPYFRINDSGGHTATNCSFLANGAVNPGFDPDQIDRDNIGVTADFPF